MSKGKFKAGDEQHRALITECSEKGHDWTHWEDVKHLGGMSRTCRRCKLFDHTESAASYAIGSIWEDAHKIHYLHGLPPIRLK